MRTDVQVCSQMFKYVWSRTFAEFSDFRETDKSLKHELDQFKDPVSHMCLAGTVVAPWSLAQEVAG